MPWVCKNCNIINKDEEKICCNCNLPSNCTLPTEKSSSRIGIISFIFSLPGAISICILLLNFLFRHQFIPGAFLWKILRDIIPLSIPLALVSIIVGVISEIRNENKYGAVGVLLSVISLPILFILTLFITGR